MKIPKPRKLPSGNWFIQLRLDGVSVPVTARNERECKKEAQLIKAEHLAGRRLVVTSTTLRQAIDKYIAARNNTLSPATVRGYTIIRDNRFKSVMDQSIKNISDWQTICNEEAKLYSAKTLKNSWMFVVSVLRENGVNVPKVSLPQVVINKRPFLDSVQIPLFIAAVKDHSCEIPALLALHGLRRSEIFALAWSDIDLAKKSIQVAGAAVYNEEGKLVPKKANKNQSSTRIVPIMIPRLSEVLSACGEQSGLVVLNTPGAIYKQINVVCGQNNLPAIGFHGLRHSFASLAYHLKMPEKLAMQLGGWSDITTMNKIYTHLAAHDVTKYENIMSDYYKNANELAK